MTSNKKHLSPLRYPGGKTKYANLLSDVLSANNMQSVHFVEPFGGGAGAAINLLLTGRVKTIHINDYDRNIYAIWYAILNHTDEFIDKIRHENLNIDLWHSKSRIVNSNSRSLMERGYAAFILNRCNRSGILNARPIGGLEQKGKWKLDARFNKNGLIRRINNIKLYKKMITISSIDAFNEFDELVKLSDKDNSFYFIDPPYFLGKGDLYLSSASWSDHENLAKYLRSKPKIKYLLTYDKSDSIKELYKSNISKVIELPYTANLKKKGKEYIIYSPTIVAA